MLFASRSRRKVLLRQRFLPQKMIVVLVLLVYSVRKFDFWEYSGDTRDLQELKRGKYKKRHADEHF